MNLFKYFIVGQRKIELYQVFIVIAENISPILYEYITDLQEIKFLDGEYHKYCGELKSVVNTFVNYWTDVIDGCVREADALSHEILTKKQLGLWVDDGIERQQIKQKKFLESFLPTESDEEKKQLQEIEELFDKNIKGLRVMRGEIVRYDRPELVEEFVKYHCDLSIQKKNEAFSFTHKTIAIRLANRIYRIRVSFEEILSRARKNLQKLREEDNEKLHNLLKDLYDENKERLQVSRQEFHRTTDTAEVDNAIRKIREKIEFRGMKARPIIRLEEEVRHWQRRLEEFGEIEKTILKLRTEIANVKEYQKQYEEMRTIELPGSKKTCFENMGENFKERLEYLENTLEEVAQTLMTFFAIRGKNHILYKDNIGHYTVDEFGHQIYHFYNSRKTYHVTCDGTMRQVKDSDLYYYDDCGRYVKDEKGEKVYQCAACTSTYRLGEDELLEKTTKDCNHSEIPNPKCKMQQRNPNIVELLPKSDPIDIQKTLSHEVVQYLWDSVAYILPNALRDTGQARPLNPLYYLAHRLFHHKYILNNLTQLREKRKESDLYRANIFKQRKDDDVAATRAWKAKQVKPRKPEESDDTEARAVYNQYLANKELINKITYYDYN